MVLHVFLFVDDNRISCSKFTTIFVMLMVEKITHKKVVGLETTEQASVYEKHSCVIIARLASSYKYLGV